MLPFRAVRRPVLASVFAFVRLHRFCHGVHVAWGGIVRMSSATLAVFCNAACAVARSFQIIERRV